MSNRYFQLVQQICALYSQNVKWTCFFKLDYLHHCQYLQILSDGHFFVNLTRIGQGWNESYFTIVIFQVTVYTSNSSQSPTAFSVIIDHRLSHQQGHQPSVCANHHLIHVLLKCIHSTSSILVYTKLRRVGG